MTKLLKKLSIFFVAVMCMISCFGCSCARRLSIKYTVQVSNEDGTEEFKHDLGATMKVEKKFREPANTPCYKKVGDTYELVEDSSVSVCYDSTGEKKFERVTVGKIEKLELENNSVINTHNGKDIRNYESSYTKIPDNELYSLIYTFELVNMSKDDKIYIQEVGLSKEGILGEKLKEDSLENKVEYTIEGANVDADTKYYYLDGYGKSGSYQKMKITIVLKYLTNKDSADTRNKNLNLKFNIVIK